MISDQLIKDVNTEIASARKHFPAFHSHHEAYAVILEEVEELWDCIKNNSNAGMKYFELIQVIAMCVCYDKEILSK